MTTDVRTQSITSGQIGQISDRLATKLRMSNLSSGRVQEVLMMPGNAAIEEMVAVFCKHADLQNNVIIRHVVVNRARSPLEAIAATRRDPHLNKNVVAMMPRGKGDEADVIFFKLGHDISNDDLEEEYKRRGLKPVDPYTLAAVNEDDPTFADEHPNSAPWEDANGRKCYAGFDCWGGVDRVVIYLNGTGWNDRWWFGGVRK